MKPPLLLLLCLLIAAPLQAREPSARFNPGDWALAWQAFMGSGKVEDAYQLALSALKANPRSLLWHRRLAQVAPQANHPDAALDAEYWLILQSRQWQRLPRAIKLAQELGDQSRLAKLLTVKLRREPFNAADWRALINSELDQGAFAAAIHRLQSADRRHPRPLFLLLQARVYRAQGAPDQELAILRRYLKRYGAQAGIALRVATLEYLQGRFQEAYQVLVQARASASGDDVAYWRTLSGLAWLLQDYHQAALASAVLSDSGQAQTVDYQRLYLVYRARQPQKAFQLTLRGWQHTRDPSLFLDLLSLASQLQQPRWLDRAFAQLHPQDRRGLQDQPLYWTSLARWYALAGHFDRARRSYARALRRFPHNQDLWAGYLWLLVEHHQTRSLAELVPRFHQLDQAPEDLRAALASAYSALQQPQRALRLLNQDLPQHRDDPDWLINYADTLAQADHPRRAFRWRRRAWQLLGRSDAEPARVQRQRAALATTLTPGDPALRLVKPLAGQPQQPQDRELVLAWALDRSNQALARWWIEHAYQRQGAPVWARLALAQDAHDRPVLGQLLARDADQLPRRDRVGAAHDLGWDDLATTLAFQGLAGEPGDRQLQGQFRELALAHSDWAQLSVPFEQSGGWQALTPTLQARHWLTPSTSLSASLRESRQKVSNQGQWGTLPASSREGSLHLDHHYNDRLHLGLTLGGGRDIDAYSRWGLDADYRWNQALRASLSLLRGARPDASQALALGAVEDRVLLQTHYQLDQYQQLDSSAQWGQYLAQGGGGLGGIKALGVDYGYQLWSVPPQVGLSLSLTGASFSSADTLPQQLRPLVPASQSPSVGFFIPKDYLQMCAGAGLNTRFRREYSARPRPFAAVSLCQNSQSGTGYTVSAGLALPWLGPDHWVLALDYGNNVGATGSKTLRIGIRYRYYLTPERTIGSPSGILSRQ